MRRSSTTTCTGTTSIIAMSTTPRRHPVNLTLTLTCMRRYATGIATIPICITGTATEAGARCYFRLLPDNAVARPRPMYIVPGIQRRVSATPRRARSQCAALPAVSA